VRNGIAKKKTRISIGDFFHGYFIIFDFEMNNKGINDFSVRTGKSMQI
jgi:hypothetical protein